MASLSSSVSLFGIQALHGGGRDTDSEPEFGMGSEAHQA